MTCQTSQHRCASRDTRLCLKVAATTIDVRQALIAIGGWIDGHGFAKGDAELVLAELLNNLVEHGEIDVQVPINLHLWLDAKDLRCEMSDTGKPFSPAQATASEMCHQLTPLEGLPEGGFGLFLVQQLTHDLTYSSANNGNQLGFRLPLTPKSEQI